MLKPRPYGLLRKSIGWQRDAAYHAASARRLRDAGDEHGAIMYQRFAENAAKNAADHFTLATRKGLRSP